MHDRRCLELGSARVGVEGGWSVFSAVISINDPFQGARRQLPMKMAEKLNPPPN
jgi:hypothetical protein